MSAYESQIQKGMQSLLSFFNSLPPQVLWVTLAALIVAAFILFLSLVLLIRKRSHERTVLEITDRVAGRIAARIEEKEIKENKQKAREKERKRKEELKAKRKYLKKRVGELEKKQFTVGLTRKEEIKKKSSEQELLRIEEKLLANDAFLDELNEKAEEILAKARLGVPSKSLREQLRRKGYSQKEIAIIKKLFQIKKEKTEKPDSEKKKNTGRKH